MKIYAKWVKDFGDKPMCSLETVGDSIVITPAEGVSMEQCEEELTFQFDVNGRRITSADGDLYLAELLHVGNGYWYHSVHAS